MLTYEEGDQQCRKVALDLNNSNSSSRTKINREDNKRSTITRMINTMKKSSIVSDKKFKSRYRRERPTKVVIGERWQKVEKPIAKL